MGRNPDKGAATSRRLISVFSAVLGSMVIATACGENGDTAPANGADSSAAPEYVEVAV